MDTVGFFDRVLAHTGLRCRGIPVEREVDGKITHPFRHRFYGTNDALAAACLRSDKHGETVYFACATYQTADKRTQANAGWMRAFWADVDVGPDKPYATRKLAIAALKALLRATGLPLPLIVLSGVGLHLYWTLDTDVTRTQWEPVAGLLKQVMAHAAFHADPTRTADAASVLRPAGTTHRKAGNVEVSVLAEGAVVPLARIEDTLRRYASTHTLSPVKTWDRDANKTHSAPNTDALNSEYALPPVTYAPSDIRKTMAGCAQINHAIRSRGDVSYETWRLGIGLIKCSVPDEAKARDLARVATSERANTGHTNTDWETRFNTWNAGPPTCEKFRQASPSGCLGCIHHKTITSPIRLGEPSIDSAPIVAAPLKISPTQTDALTYAGVTLDDTHIKLKMPAGWMKAEIPQRATTGLVQLQKEKSKDDDGNDIWVDVQVPFCPTVFFPVQRLDVGSEEGAGMTVEMWVRVDDDGRPTERRRFVLPNAAISDTSVLLRELARQEIVPLYPNQGVTMKAYLNDWITELRQKAQSVKQLQHFGWVEDGFLVGETLFRQDGTAQTVTLRGMAAEQAQALSPRGSPQVWHDVIHRAYNHPGQEHYQFLVALGFAAPLFALFGEYGGATVFAQSTTTGRGKTTAQRASLSIWGNWDQLMLSEGKATANYLWRHIGAAHNLPIAYDELTNLSNQAASELVFSISAGSQRRRLRQDGTPQERGANWQTLLLASGNTSLVEKLSLHRADASAEMARVFEFTVPAGSPLTVATANEIFPLLIDNYGWAGFKFASFLARNKAAVQRSLSLVRQRITDDCAITASERYWAAIMASALTALHICNKLGLLQFPLASLKQWLYLRLADNRAQLRASVSADTELFGDMMRDLWGGMLVTEGLGDLRKTFGDARVLNGGPRGATLHGRYIIGGPGPDGITVASRLEISLRSVKEWASKRGVSASQMQRAMVDAGFASARHDPVCLGRGTRGYAAQPQVRCISVFPDAWMDVASPLAAQLRVVTGGLLKGDDAHA